MLFRHHEEKHEGSAAGRDHDQRAKERYFAGARTRAAGHTKASAGATEERRDHAAMKVILFGATGMVGQGVLRQCLLDPVVEHVQAVGRSATGQTHEKLRELVLQDLLDYSAIENQLPGYDACFFCLGVTSAGMTERDYRRVTFDITMAAARTLARHNPQMTFAQVRHDDGADGTRDDPRRPEGRSEAGARERGHQRDLRRVMSARQLVLLDEFGDLQSFRAAATSR